jgi:hypothetical protein
MASSFHQALKPSIPNNLKRVQAFTGPAYNLSSDQRREFTVASQFNVLTLSLSLYVAGVNISPYPYPFF